MPRQNRMECSQDISAVEHAGDRFFDRLVTVDEIWIRFYDPLTQEAKEGHTDSVPAPC